MCAGDSKKAKGIWFAFLSFPLVPVTAHNSEHNSSITASSFPLARPKTALETWPTFDLWFLPLNRLPLALALGTLLVSPLLQILLSLLLLYSLTLRYTLLSLRPFLLALLLGFLFTLQRLFEK